MAKPDPRKLQPTPHRFEGMAWELIEPMLRAAAADRPCCSVDHRDTFAAYFSAVRDVRQCATREGIPALSWVAYGVAMLSGPYQRDRVAMQGSCPACGTLIAANRGKPCAACKVERKRAKHREFSRSYRRRHGLVQSFGIESCSHCGEVFSPKRSTARFCSARCRVAAHRADRSAKGAA
jgi:hypothetical protein